MSEPERRLLGLAGGSVRVWWYPAPRAGEVVPDYPPVELTASVEPAELGDADDGEEEGPCAGCEWCTWNPGPDCGRPEHPHCPTCGHCEGRHA